MRIGYACQLLSSVELNTRSLNLKNVTRDKLIEITNHNLNILEKLLDYNITHGIGIFRLSSDIVPFASHPEVDFPWQELFRERLSDLGAKARAADMRLSMHPGQYTVLNSPNPEVVTRAVDDLRYHCDFLDLMGMDCTCKLILHIGGAYGNKEAATERFKDNYKLLPQNIKRRLIIENDDRIYKAVEVLAIAQDMGIPMVFDNLHNQVNPSNGDWTEIEWLRACTHTWQKADGTPKMHYSEQALDKKTGAHSDTIHIEPFMEFIDKLDFDVDIMLEVKDKNLSALKCLNCTSNEGQVRSLEEEWARYKYSVLEHSPNVYKQIRTLLKDKRAYNAFAFYRLIEAGIETPGTTGTYMNSLQHVWGYFKLKADEKEKKRFDSLLASFQEGKSSLRAVKNHLYRLAEKYGEEYLLNSYYFLEHWN